MSDNKKIQGEGDYDAARNYRERTEDFVNSGNLQKQNQDLENIEESDLAELEEAERVGKSRVKDEDPELSANHSDTK